MLIFLVVSLTPEVHPKGPTSSTAGIALYVPP